MYVIVCMCLHGVLQMGGFSAWAALSVCLARPNARRGGVKQPIQTCPGYMAFPTR